MENIFKKALTGIETADKEKEKIESFIHKAQEIQKITDESDADKGLKRKFVVDSLRAWLEGRDIRFDEVKRTEVSRRRRELTEGYKNDPEFKALMDEMDPAEAERRAQVRLISDNTSEQTPPGTPQTDPEA